MGERFRTFVEFMADNPDGLLTTIQITERVKPVTFEMAKAALLCLARRKSFSCKKLIRRCRHHKWGSKLLEAVAHYFQGKKRWKKFARALLSTPASWWHEYFSVDVAQKTLDDPRVMELLIQKLPTMLSDDAYGEEHPLLEYVRPDKYWANQVRRYLATYDYRRAWDEVKKASKGIRISEPGEQCNPFNEDDSSRKFAASKSVIGELVRELFAELVAHGFLTPLPEGDYTLESRRERVQVYETKLARNYRHAPRAYQQAVPVAGLEFARMFHLSSSDRLYPRFPSHFSIEGGMILRMARYFADKKAESRRQRHAKAVAEYLRLTGETQS